jgi:membrane-associated protein
LKLLDSFSAEDKPGPPGRGLNPGSEQSMDFQSITREILEFTGTANIWLVVSLLVMLSISEFGLSIPYLMETVWILAGYQALNGSMPVYFLVLLWFTAMCGRTLGAVVLYHLARFSSSGLMRLYRRIFRSALQVREPGSSPLPPSRSLPARIWRKINSLSPYSVAFGRLIWLRVPLTLTLGFRKQIKILIPGVVISSAIWDTTYILVGVVGGNIHLQPFQIVIFSLCALTIIYGGTFLVRWIIKLVEARQFPGAVN